MGYRLNRLDETVFMVVPKPLLTEFDIHYRLESGAQFSSSFATKEEKGLIFRNILAYGPKLFMTSLDSSLTRLSKF